MIEYTLPPPISTNKLRTVARGRIVDSPAYRAWKKTANALLRLSQRAHKAPFSGPVAVAIMIPDNCKMDCDNTLKATLDALEKAGVFGNDRNVRHLTISYGGDAFTARVEAMEVAA